MLAVELAVGADLTGRSELPGIETLASTRLISFAIAVNHPNSAPKSGSQRAAETETGETGQDGRGWP